MAAEEAHRIARGRGLDAIARHGVLEAACRAFGAFWICLLALLVCAGPSAADGRYAALAIDANTGQVLSAEAADEPRYPASLTKVMTLYIVFEQMQLGRLSADTRISISAEAASVPPSRLGLRPGSTIALGDAIKALVTKSANDIAVAVAEHIAGSEERFAELMTRKARDLGMSRTTFRNPHGLPDSEQTTTARDMLTLALRLYDAFPREARYFSLRSFSYGGRDYRNHNTMLFSFAGMDGIKTGYTRASGFNLLASVHRDGRHVLAVVLGGTSASARNARMRVLLTRGLAQASTEKTRRRLVVAARPAPRPAAAARPAPVPIAAGRPSAPAPRLVEPVAAASSPASPVSSRAGGDGGWSPNVRLAAPVMTDNSVASRLGVNNGWRPAVEAEPRTGRSPSTLQAQAARLASGPVAVASAGGRRASANGGSEIQIGAFSNESEARDRLAAARQLSPGLLGSAGIAMPQVKVGRRTLYRARFVGLEASAATLACAALRQHRVECIVARHE